MFGVKLIIQIGSGGSKVYAKFDAYFVQGASILILTYEVGLETVKVFLLKLMKLLMLVRAGFGVML